MKIKKFLLFALLSLFLAGCSGSNENLGYCASCSRETILTDICPACYSGICDLCAEDINSNVNCDLEEKYEEGFHEGYSQSYYEAFQAGCRLVLDYMTDAEREAWFEINHDVVLEYDITY